MKRISCLFVAFMIFMATGCVKMDYSMTVGKDKSVDFKIIEAVNKKVLESSGQNAFNETDLEQYRKDGYSIREYDDGTNAGYVFSLKIDDINEISTEESINSKLEMYTTKDGKKYFFTVKKGLFRNKYTAVFVSDVSDSIKDSINDIETKDNKTNTKDTTTVTDKETNVTDKVTDNKTDSTTVDKTTDSTTTKDTLSDSDLTDLMNTMEAKFSINLPYGAIKSNAKDISEDGKTLTWDLISLDGNIEFEFYLYNIIPLFVLAGSTLLLLIIIIVLIIRHIQNKKYLKLALERERREQEELKKADDSEEENTKDEVLSSNTSLNDISTDENKYEEELTEQVGLDESDENAFGADEVDNSSENLETNELEEPKNLKVNNDYYSNNVEDTFEPVESSDVESVDNSQNSDINNDDVSNSDEDTFESNEVKQDVEEVENKPNFHFEEIVTPENVNNFHVEEIITPENVDKLENKEK